MKTKYKFWVTSSRMTDIKENVELCWENENIPDDVVKSELYEWCERVFPMFHFTDAFVQYGYEKLL